LPELCSGHCGAQSAGWSLPGSLAGIPLKGRRTFGRYSVRKKRRLRHRRRRVNVSGHPFRLSDLGWVWINYGLRRWPPPRGVLVRAAHRLPAPGPGRGSCSVVAGATLVGGWLAILRGLARLGGCSGGDSHPVTPGVWQGRYHPLGPSSGGRLLCRAFPPSGWSSADCAPVADVRSAGCSWPGWRVVLVSG